MALTDKLTDIADAIREVGGTTAKLTPAEMPDAIGAAMETADAVIAGTFSGAYVNDRITSLGKCFCENTTVTSVSCANVVTVRRNAFNPCSSVTSIDLPSCTYIDYAGLGGCTKLTGVNLPALRTVVQYTFSDDKSLAKLRLPSLKNTHFGSFYNCTSLAALILPGSFVTAQSTMDNTLYSTPILNGTGYIYVPRDLVDTYKAATNWSVVAAQFRAIEDYPDICSD